jgi:outer membrane lipoprotein-sorting protein
MRFIQILCAVLFPFILSTGLNASDGRGLEIAAEADNRDIGFGDTISTMTMTLYDQYGNTTSRKIRNKTLEGTDQGDLSLVIFDTPADVKGTAFLSHTKKAGSDDQWLYLPALKRVKRIASSNQAGPFMGSEFAYEDISSQELEKYTYKYLRNENYGGLDCFVVEYDPVDRKSGYSKQIVWIDSEEYRSHKIEFYDRKESLLKTLLYTGYNKYNDKFWRADVFEMQNHQTGKKTILNFDDWEFQTGLSAKDFNKKSLKKVR